MESSDHTENEEWRNAVKVVIQWGQGNCSQFKTEWQMSRAQNEIHSFMLLCLIKQVSHFFYWRIKWLHEWFNSNQTLGLVNPGVVILSGQLCRSQWHTHMFSEGCCFNSSRKGGEDYWEMSLLLEVDVSLCCGDIFLETGCIK